MQTHSPSQLRLNYGKTFLLGFGFFGVSVIWGVYNAFVPLFMVAAFLLMAGVRRGEAVAAPAPAG